MAFFRRKSDPKSNIEPYQPPADDDPPAPEPVAGRRLSPLELQAARRVARERYQLIAEALKREAGVRQHYTQKEISGLAWLQERKILAPNGITRRQLYVLAHECGHIVLHSHSSAWSKPGHVKEHEAETYAHRAFERYGLEVPDKSARWARAYVGQWIMKDRAEGISICAMAEAFANGTRAPSDPLPAVDGNPKTDFSKAIERHTGKSLRIAAKQDAVTLDVEATPAAPPVPKGPPNACGTCMYLRRSDSNYKDHQCDAYLQDISKARYNHRLCNDGFGWRPKRRGFFARLFGRTEA
jgi:Ni/Co efflux regulator RcnB